MSMDFHGTLTIAGIGDAAAAAAALALSFLGFRAARRSWRAARTAAETARRIAEGDRMRAALLATLGHDLRSPLAAAKAAVSGLRAADVHLTADDRGELLVAADESLDQLARLAASLLDISRLQAGKLAVFPGRLCSGTSSRALSTTSARDRSRCAPRRGCPRSWRTRHSWSGSS